MKLEALKEYLYIVVGAIYDTHKELGPGLNEYVYQEGLEVEFKQSPADMQHLTLHHDKKDEILFRAHKRYAVV